MLQGSGSKGSVFEDCTWEGGSEAHKDLIYYCGMVSMHGVDDLTVRNCSVGENYLGDDAMHLAYCKNFTIAGCRFDQARSDALDVDISRGKIVSSRFLNSGNDTLDLMTSVVQVKKSLFKNAGDKGISVGEKSDLVVDGSVFCRCNIGIEIKDNSVVGLEQSIFRKCDTAINLYKKNWRYGGGGILKAEDSIYAVGCTANLKKDKHSTTMVNTIKTQDPDLSVWRRTVSEAASHAPAIEGG
ncbi:MAG: right-handed parallel beta-helix repeat-containing protein [Deltaproteobacteria bacterium]|nr:right-handed parallel beta-helix repeat-containing protein [Deltaproteobacteria bacterium]